ncbi:MAG: terpene cyclase/mutase family protein [Kiritimatiellae bacterium]|nr:terpene cyclase/mutase family protein [Kiritimatiellia bacterium]
MTRRVRDALEHLTGPVGSVVLHLLIVFALAHGVVVRLQRREPELRVKFDVTVEPPDVDRMPEPLPRLKPVDDAIRVVAAAPLVDFTDVLPEPLRETLSILDGPSPAVINLGLYKTRAADARPRLAAERAGRWAPDAERAVCKALQWLKARQSADGSWNEAGRPDYAPGVTGLALLTFLAHGETTASAEFGGTVRLAVEFLLKAQREDGAFFGDARQPAAETGTPYGENMYAPYWHAMAAYALSEAYGLMRIPELKPAMQKAVQVIIDGQQPGGGWNYAYAKTARRDTSIAGWQIQALKAAAIAGAENPGLTAALQRAADEVRSHRIPATGLFCYENRDRDAERDLPRPRLQINTGIGVLALQLLGLGASREAKDGLEALRSARCAWSNPANTQSVFWLYGWYYITQARFHQGGAEWPAWNDAFAATLTRNQQDDGHWDAPRASGQPCIEDRFGPVYCTSLAALTLQVYYRCLPTFKAEAVQAAASAAERAPDDVLIEF